MPTIAVVDDRDVETVKKRLERAIRDEGQSERWTVLTTEPLSGLEQYGAWVEEEDVAVLLLDERLNEAGTMVRPYAGHDVVHRLRPRDFALPIYYLTEIVEDANVEADAAKVNDIIARGELLTGDISEVRQRVREFMREGERYKEQVARRLARLSEIAHSVVEGRATEEELTEAASIREQLALPYDGYAGAEAIEATRVEWLDLFEKQIAELESLAADLRKVAKQDERSAPKKGFNR